MDIQDLRTTGFVRVPYPPMLRMRAREAMESWQSFCALPAHKKRWLSLGDRIKDIGYVLRQDSGPRADSKEFFHASRGMPEEVKERAVQTLDGRAIRFIDATNALLRDVAPLIRTFARLVERGWGLAGFEDEVMDNQDNWKFRYLHYFPSSSGNEIAHAHADRGGFTLHMGESHPGAEYLTFGKWWRPLPIGPHETIIFPSMGLQRRSGSELKALCHRVRATPEAADEGRYSMVAFIDFVDTHKFDDAKYRLQDFEPGFNYTMPPKEFEKLFVPR